MIDLKLLTNGLLEQEEDVRDYTPELLGVSPDNGTDTIMIDTPSAYDQFGMMCVANSLAMGASILNKTDSGEFIKFSRADFYGPKELPGEGSSLRSMMKQWCKRGVCLESLYDVQGTYEQCNQTYEDNKLEADFSAYTGKIEFFYKVTTEGDFRSALLDGLPIYIAYDVYNNCFPDSDGHIPLPVGDKIGGHCSVVKGHKPGYVRVLNSWGEEWGENGEGWLPFEMVRIAYVGVDYDTSTKYVYFIADEDYYMKNGKKIYMTGLDEQGNMVPVYARIIDGRMNAPVKYFCDAFDIPLIEYYSSLKAALFSNVGVER